MTTLLTGKQHTLGRIPVSCRLLRKGGPVSWTPGRAIGAIVSGNLHFLLVGPRLLHDSLHTTAPLSLHQGRNTNISRGRVIDALVYATARIPRLEPSPRPGLAHS